MPKKILVAVPSFTHIYPRPFRNFAQIFFVAGRSCPDYKFAFLTPERLALAYAMNSLGQTVIEQNFDALIVFDDDCFPPFDCIPRLLKHFENGEDFVAGLGVMRGFPHTTTVGQWLPEGMSAVKRPNGSVTLSGHRWLDNVDDFPPLTSVDFCGVPVAIISRTALLTIPQPWFGTHSPDGGTVTHDIFFCRLLQKYGFQPKVDTTLKCGHLSEAPIITFENRTLARELMEIPDDEEKDPSVGGSDPRPS